MNKKLEQNTISMEQYKRNYKIRFEAYSAVFELFAEKVNLTVGEEHEVEADQLRQLYDEYFKNYLGRPSEISRNMFNRILRAEGYSIVRINKKFFVLVK